MGTSDSGKHSEWEREYHLILPPITCVSVHKFNIWDSFSSPRRSAVLTNELKLVTSLTVSALKQDWEGLVPTADVYKRSPSSPALLAYMSLEWAQLSKQNSLDWVA